MKRSLIALGVALLAGCGGGGGLAGGGGFVMMPPVAMVPAPADPTPPPTDCSVTLEGDSVLAGGYFPLGKLTSTPAMTLRRERPRLVVTDKSVPGASAYGSVERVLNEPVTSRVTVISFGLNDEPAGKPYETNMRAMVDRVRSFGKVAILTGVSRTKHGASPTIQGYNEAVRRIASDTGSAYADWPAVRYAPEDMADEVHPGQPYSDRLTAALIQSIDTLLPECK